MCQDPEVPSLGFNKATKQHKAPTVVMAVRIIKEDVTESREGDDRLAGKQQKNTNRNVIRAQGMRNKRRTMNEILRQQVPTRSSQAAKQVSKHCQDSRKERKEGQRSLRNPGLLRQFKTHFLPDSDLAFPHNMFLSLHQ